MATATKPAEPMAIEWEVIEGENTEFAVQYPRMQWVHGRPAAAGFMKSGGLFISTEQYPNFSGEGFQPGVLITNEGEEIEGFTAADTKLAVIRVKHQWIKDEKYHRNVPLAHALVAVKGCDDLICLSLKGATKSLEFQKAFNQHIGQNVAVANRTRPQGAPALEPFALWFPVKAAKNQMVQAKDSNEKSSVTPPELVAPEKVDREHVVKLWVGADKYKQFAAFYRETATWQKAPIWEQRAEADDSDVPAFSGEGESGGATDGQLQMLFELSGIKGVSEAELMKGVSHGELTHFDQLSRDDARAIIEKLKTL